MSDPDAPADRIAAATPSPSQNGHVAPAGWQPPAVQGRRRGRIWPWIVLGLVVGVVVAGEDASHISLNE